MKVTVYTQVQCGLCRATRHALESRGAPYEAVDVMHSATSLNQIKGLGYLTVPVIVVEDDDGKVIEHWGGFQLDRIADLAAQLRMQEVDE